MMGYVAGSASQISLNDISAAGFVAFVASVRCDAYKRLASNRRGRAPGAPSFCRTRRATIGATGARTAALRAVRLVSIRRAFISLELGLLLAPLGPAVRSIALLQPRGPVCKQQCQCPLGTRTRGTPTAPQLAATIMTAAPRTHPPKKRTGCIVHSNGHCRSAGRRPRALRGARWPRGCWSGASRPRGVPARGARRTCGPRAAATGRSRGARRPAARRAEAP